MFDHVTIHVSDRDAAERFYDAVLDPLGIEKTHSDERYAEWDDFSLTAAEDPRRVTRGLHVGFVAPSRAHADRFWRAGTAAGHRDDGPPGPRPEYTPDHYGAFLLDPDGNSAEAVHHESVREPGHIDHLLDPRGGPRGCTTLLRDRRPIHGLRAEGGRGARPVRRRGLLVHARAQRGDGEPGTGLPGEQRRDGRRVPSRGDRRRLPQRGAPGSGPPTTPAATAPTSSIRTATTWRW